VSETVDWDEDDDSGLRPYGGKPYGGKPYGGKPYGGKPYGGKPYGGKPYGGKPYGGKPYGGKPYGGKPYGGKPYGGKPYGGKPYGGKSDVSDPGDWDEWSVDIGELVCERSAVIRQGATLFTGDELELPALAAAPAYRAPGQPSQAPLPPAQPPPSLRPGAWTLEAVVAVPLTILGVITANPDVAYMLKLDLAESLAQRADATFLAGTAAGGGPPGIADLVARTPGPVAGGGQRLQRLRNLVAAIRATEPLRNPGWVLHPAALDAVATFFTRDVVTASTASGRRSVDTFDIFKYDGADGGMLLGFPFLTSAGAVWRQRPAAFFSADWEEAWIGFDPSFIRVTFPGAGAGGAINLTVSMQLDFALRRTSAFAWAVA